MLKKLVPIVLLLQHVSETFRHNFDGFVIEDRGKFVSLVVTASSGAKSKRWEIGNVATHLDYRRRGLARRLVGRAYEHAREHGAEMCLLEVCAGNILAYLLYRSQGFEHDDSTTVKKLEELPDVPGMPARGYTIRSMKYGEWLPRFELAKLETPAEVQNFIPVDPEDFRVSALEKLFEPVARITQKMISTVGRSRRMASSLGFPPWPNGPPRPRSSIASIYASCPTTGQSWENPC